MTNKEGGAGSHGCASSLFWRVVAVLMPTPGFVSIIAGVIVIVVGAAYGTAWCAGGGYGFVLGAVGVLLIGLGVALMGAIPAFYISSGAALVILIVGLLVLQSHGCL